MQEYTAYDGEQPIQFTGRLLAFVSSDSTYAPRQRWTEITIFRTQAGKYVIFKVGRSVVEGERDLNSTRVCETAEGVIESLRMIDHDGVMTMRATDKRALAQAMLEDADLEAAYKAGIRIA